MPNLRSWMNVVLLLALAAAGCRLPGRDRAAAQSLVDCRRLSQRGIAALDHGQLDKAEKLLADAVAACPVDPEARRRYAESLWRRGARKEAISQLEQAGNLMGEDAALSARLADMLLADGQLERARIHAERAVTLDPKLPEAWTARGGVMRAARQPEAALADYLRALGYAPDDRAILLQIADLHRQLNQPEMALHTLHTLAESYPPGEEPAEVHFRMGGAYAALGRHAESVECFSAAVLRGPPTPEMFCALAEAQLLAGRASEAAAAARQALALHPQHPGGQELLRRIEFAQQPPDATRR